MLSGQGCVTGAARAIAANDANHMNVIIHYTRIMNITRASIDS